MKMNWERIRVPGNWVMLFVVGLLISSCDRSGTLITQRIQYDVEIRNTTNTGDWWVKNIEGSKRGPFIESLFDMAYEGVLPAYDAYNKQPLTPEQVKAIGNHVDTITFQRAESPYDFYDTIVKHQLNLSDVSRLRFLEEWRYDREQTRIEKTVLGVAPILEVYGDDGQLRGYMPLFWLAYQSPFALAPKQ